MVCVRVCVCARVLCNVVNAMWCVYRVPWRVWCVVWHAAFGVPRVVCCACGVVCRLARVVYLWVWCRVVCGAYRVVCRVRSCDAWCVSCAMW